MTTPQIIITIFEFLLIVSVILCMIFEYKLIGFEDKIKEKIRKYFKR